MKKEKQETFASLMESFRYKFDVHTAFNDFLTMSICAYGRDYATGQSKDEELYMQTILKYATSDERHVFPKLLAQLPFEMEEDMGKSGGDVIGSYYELNLAKKNSGQYFTPWPICQLMAHSLVGGTPETDTKLRIIDPCCGSGRMLLAGAQVHGKEHHYYGIDIDHTCVKMAALNLFLNGIFHAEVMWGDALRPDDFRMSYYTSFLPFGIYRISEKEKSPLWHMHLNSFHRNPQDAPKPNIILPSESGQQDTGQAAQLHLF